MSNTYPALRDCDSPRRRFWMLSSPPPAWRNGPVRLYHGTFDHYVASILAGVDLATVRGYRDFGRGFYTTTSLEQATSWAVYQAERPTATGAPAVIEFTLNLDPLSRLDILAFVRGERTYDAFWSLVWHCRQADTNHGRAVNGGWYDIVVGPVAAFWEQRLTVGNSDQLSFHTDRAVQLLNASRPRRVL